MLGSGATELHRTDVRCLECDVVAMGSTDGWKAYIGGGYKSEPVDVVVYCPSYAAREFGASE
jgi:hypothetical protein